MNLIAFQTLNHETLSNIIGGGCSWKEAGKSTVTGAIGGAVSGTIAPGGGTVVGGLAGGVAYGATCWW